MFGYGACHVAMWCHVGSFAFEWESIKNGSSLGFPSHLGARLSRKYEDYIEIENVRVLTYLHYTVSKRLHITSH